MREQIGNMQYRGKGVQLVKAKPPQAREIQGRTYHEVDYGWGPTLVDTNAVGGPRSSYEQSAKAALKADIAESKRRRDVAPSLTTKETQEALLDADTARKSRLGVSETYAPPGSSGARSAGGTRRATGTGAMAAPGASVMDVRPDLTSYRPPALDNKSWATSNNGFDRFATADMADLKKQEKYFDDNQVEMPGGAIVRRPESGKVLRLDPTPRYKAEEGMSPDEMRQNRPALDATRRNYDLAKEEQAHTEQVASEAASAKAEAAAREKQADRDANQTLKELEQLGGIDKEVIGAYSGQLQALQEQLSSGSKIGPNGMPVPMTEDEMSVARADKANLLTDIRSTRNTYLPKNGGATNIGDAISKALGTGAIQPGEAPPPGPIMAPSSSPYAAPVATKVAPRVPTQAPQLSRNDVINSRFAEIPLPLDAPQRPRGLSDMAKGVTNSLRSLKNRANEAGGFKQKLKALEKYNNERYEEGAPKRKFSTRPRTPVTKLPSILEPLRKPGERKTKKKEK